MMTWAAGAGCTFHHDRVQCHHHIMDMENATNVPLIYHIACNIGEYVRGTWLEEIDVCMEEESLLVQVLQSHCH